MRARVLVVGHDPDEALVPFDSQIELDEPRAVLVEDEELTHFEEVCRTEGIDAATLSVTIAGP